MITPEQEAEQRDELATLSDQDLIERTQEYERTLGRLPSTVYLSLAYSELNRRGIDRGTWHIAAIANRRTVKHVDPDYHPRRRGPRR